jgi:hypothetical protein
MTPYSDTVRSVPYVGSTLDSIYGTSVDLAKWISDLFGGGKGRPDGGASLTPVEPLVDLTENPVDIKGKGKSFSLLPILDPIDHIEKLKVKYGEYGQGYCDGYSDASDYFQKYLQEFSFGNIPLNDSDSGSTTPKAGSSKLDGSILIPYLFQGYGGNQRTK